MGRPVIRAWIVPDLASAQKRLAAERDENTCRKEMLPSEAASLGLDLEELERPKAAERRIAGNSAAGSGQVGAKFAPTPGDADETSGKASHE